MTSRDFCYWLQGFFELTAKYSPTVALNTEQAELVRRHLALVFKHEIDPSMGDEEHRDELQAIHDAGEVMKAEVKSQLAEAVSKLPRPHDPNRRLMC